MHNPKINSNFIFYIRNSKVALWRRETQSGTFLEPHINVDNHSWVCKTDLELITSEEVFATGIANTQNGMTHIQLYSHHSQRVAGCGIMTHFKVNQMALLKLKCIQR